MHKRIHQETTSFSCYVSEVVRFQPLSADPPMPFSEEESASKAEKVMQEEGRRRDRERERQRAEAILPIRALDSFGLFNTVGERASFSSAASRTFSSFDNVECRSPISDPLRFSLPWIKKPPIKLPPIYLRQRWGEISGTESSYAPTFYLLFWRRARDRERVRVRSNLYMEWN